MIVSNQDDSSYFKQLLNFSNMEHGVLYCLKVQSFIQVLINQLDILFHVLLNPGKTKKGLLLHGTPV